MKIEKKTLTVFFSLNGLLLEIFQIATSATLIATQSDISAWFPASIAVKFNAAATPCLKNNNKYLKYSNSPLSTAGNSACLGQTVKQTVQNQGKALNFVLPSSELLVAMKRLIKLDLMIKWIGDRIPAILYFNKFSN